MEVVSVIIDDKLVDYVPKSDALTRIADAEQMKTSAIQAKNQAMQDKRQADDRLASLRILMERVLEGVSPAEKGWVVPITPSDMGELRAMLDLRAEFT